MRVTAQEGELLAPEIALFARTVHDPTTAARYTALLESVREGEVPDDQLGTLGLLLEMALESGRLRHLYGADGETALAKVFRRTPTGAALSTSASAVTESLHALRGHTLEAVQVAAVGPGSYDLTIDTDRGQVVVRLSRGGAQVRAVAVGI